MGEFLEPNQTQCLEIEAMRVSALFHEDHFPHFLEHFAARRHSLERVEIDPGGKRTSLIYDAVGPRRIRLIVEKRGYLPSANVAHFQSCPRRAARIDLDD